LAGLSPDFAVDFSGVLLERAGVRAGCELFGVVGPLAALLCAGVN
jgi:hypothetical protein